MVQPTKVLFLIDTDDDTFTARTVMTLMTQAQVDKMQAEKNMSALEKAKSRKGSKNADAEAEAEAV
jgi:ActR/RegA family two-component response regulator